MKTLTETAKVIVLSLIVVTIVSYAQAEWNNPSQDPTGGNTEPPINVSASEQTK